MTFLGRILLVSTVAAAGWLPTAARSQNLCVNGDFSQFTTNRLPEGWVCDFAWMDRSHWMQNEQYIRVLESDGAYKNVLALSIGSGNDESVIASAPMPYEHGKRYVITLDARTDGPQARLYIRGYKWKSGIRPHPAPHLRELQEVFRGRNFDELGKTWKRYTRPFPYYEKDKSSDLNLDSLKPVRFMVLYLTIPGQGKGQAVYLDNVEIIKQ